MELIRVNQSYGVDLAPLGHSMVLPGRFAWGSFHTFPRLRAPFQSCLHQLAARQNCNSPHLKSLQQILPSLPRKSPVCFTTVTPSALGCPKVLTTGLDPAGWLGNSSGLPATSLLSWADGRCKLHRFLLSALTFVLLAVFGHAFD